MIVIMIIVPFIKYKNALVKNSVALLPSEILTMVRQKGHQSADLQSRFKVGVDNILSDLI